MVLIFVDYADVGELRTFAKTAFCKHVVLEIYILSRTGLTVFVQRAAGEVRVLDGSRLARACINKHSFLDACAVHRRSILTRH